MCRSGGTGRHDSLRDYCLRKYEGSSPFSCTILFNFFWEISPFLSNLCTFLTINVIILNGIQHICLCMIIFIQTIS